MKQMCFAFIFLLCTLASHAQTIIGLDMPSLLYSELKMNVGYKISQHWSLSAAAGVNFKTLRREISTIEAEHYEEFYRNSLPKARGYTHRESFAICYWPQLAFSGPLLSFGCEYRSSTGLDACFGAGYMFKIWKGLSGCILYDIGIMRSAKTEKLSTEDINIGINWNF